MSDDTRLSIPRVGGSNPSERATGNHHKTIGEIELSGISGAGENQSLAVNARGSKRTLGDTSGRKVPEKIPDSFAQRSAAVPPTRGDRRKGFIYFVTDMKFIKIGFASDWKRRLYELQVSSPNKLTPMLVYAGSLQDEGDLHAEFQRHRRQGEWFLPADEIMAHIASKANEDVLIVIN